MNQIVKSKLTRPGSTEAVSFTDGMLVTAEDLNDAVRYPLEVVQILLRAYFGCGIVCGLDVARGGARADRNDSPRDFSLTIGRGVALDCQGYPIELCEEVTLDFRPDPCGCPIDEPEVRYIAIRRIAAPEAPSRGCGCGPAAGDPGQQCSRLRDRILVQAFDQARLPVGICMRPAIDHNDYRAEGDGRSGQCKPQAEDGPKDDASGACDCLKACPDCDRCAEPWVLLATVMVDAGGVILDRINLDSDIEDYGGPQHVKPIACLCRSESRSSAREKALEERVSKLEKRLDPSSQGGGTGPVPPAPPPPSPAPPVRGTLAAGAAAGTGRRSDPDGDGD